MSLKVFPILLIFLSINLLSSIANGEDLIRDICSGKWTQASNFTNVAKLGFQDKTFHLDLAKCRNALNQQKLKFPQKITSNLTMKRKYLFLFITLRNEMIAKNHSEFVMDFSQRVNENEWINEMKSKFLLVVWLKETTKTSFKTNYFYEIKNSFGTKTSVTKNTDQLNGSALNNQQILFDDHWLHTNDSSLKVVINIKAKTLNTYSVNEEITIRDSYIIFCAKRILSKNDKNYSMRGCSTTLVNDKLICDCSNEEQEYADYVVAIFWLGFVLLLVVPLLNDALKARNEQYLYVFSNCNYRNALFHYKITLRLGKVTKNFNLRHSLIDVQFYNSEKESLGPEVRFRTSLLKSRSLNDITINMFRLTKMPEIDKISCGHSGSDEEGIYLFGLIVKTIKHFGNDEPIDRQYIVQKYIRRERRLLVATDKSHLNEEQLSEMIRVSQKLITRSELTYYQIVFILFVVFTLFGFISLMIQINLDAYNWSTFLVTILVTLAIGGSIGAGLIFLFKYLNKSDEIEMVSLNSVRKYFCFKLFFYIICALVSLLLQRTVIESGKAIDSIQTLYWMSATIFDSSIFASIWIISYEIQKMSVPEVNESFSELSEVSQSGEKTVSESGSESARKSDSLKTDKSE